MGSTPQSFGINSGGINPSPGYSTFKPGIDSVVDFEGFPGNLLGAGGLGGKLEQMSRSEAVVGLMGKASGLFGGSKIDTVWSGSWTLDEKGDFKDTLIGIPTKNWTDKTAINALKHADSAREERIKKLDR